MNSSIRHPAGHRAVLMLGLSAGLLLGTEAMAQQRSLTGSESSSDAYLQRQLRSLEQRDSGNSPESAAIQLERRGEEDLWPIWGIQARIYRQGMHPHHARRFTVAPWLLAAVLATFAHPALAQQAQSSTKPPNIVLVLSDDEDLGIHPYMPRVKELIEDQGTVFDNFFVPYPLCCPSRASILRGQYPHNTLVLGNWAPEGGFLTFRRLKREQSTIATWLQDAGYRTALYGKYLNDYSETDAPPPGWDEWHAGNADAYDNVDYKLNANGQIEAHGDAPEDYLTDVIARRAADHIRRFSAEGRPFFLYVAPFSPHSPYNPATRHRDMFNDVDLRHPPSFNEEDVSDKPRFHPGIASPAK